jgi:hypothetical protein
VPRSSTIGTCLSALYLYPSLLLCITDTIYSSPFLWGWKTALDGDDAHDRFTTRHRLMFLRLTRSASLFAWGGNVFPSLPPSLRSINLTKSCTTQLALQTKFHTPLPYPAPYPPRPIFTRLRHPTPSEVEAGLDNTTYETSFYKNAYSMVCPPLPPSPPTNIHPHSSQIQHPTKPSSTS